MNADKLGPWVRRFLLEHLVADRNLAKNTQRSYRDTLTLLLPFTAVKLRKPIDQLTVDQLSDDVVRAFLLHLEQARNCSASTRNQRLAAIHAFARFIAGHGPEYIAWCERIRGIPFRRAERPLLPYLDKPEIDALLAAPDRSSEQGHRDYAVLLFLYNSGARASEAANLTVGDLDIRSPAGTQQSIVRVFGKGSKTRECPLWPTTARTLARLIVNRTASEPVFLNRQGQAFTRYGIHALVSRYVKKAARKHPSLHSKRVSPHTLRHTTACHLLKAGVDINTVRAWLGHVSLDTTNIYAEIDLEMKAQALAKCEVTGNPPRRSWRENRELMTFLKAL
jgi:integrase/recombinase XerD